MGRVKLTSHIVDVLGGSRVDGIVVVESVDEDVRRCRQLIGQSLPVRCHPLADGGVVPSQVQVQQFGVGIRDSSLVVDGEEEVGV